MFYQEKSIYVSLISTLLVFGYYLISVFQMVQADSLTSESVISLTITIIVLMIIVNIISHIVFNIVNRMASKELEPGFTDELDKLIDLKATRNSHMLLMAAFMLTILGSSFIDISMLVMFILFFVYLMTSCIFGEISKLYLYRKGL